MHVCIFDLVMVFCGSSFVKSNLIKKIVDSTAVCDEDVFFLKQGLTFLCWFTVFKTLVRLVLGCIVKE